MTLCDIVAAYNQVVTGAQRLIELAVGWPAEMQYGIHYQDTTTASTPKWSGTTRRNPTRSRQP